MDPAWDKGTADMPAKLWCTRLRFVNSMSEFVQNHMWTHFCNPHKYVSYRNRTEKNEWGRCTAKTGANRHEFIVVYPLGSRKLTSDFDVQMMLDFAVAWNDEDVQEVPKLVTALLQSFADVSGNHYTLSETLDVNFYPSTFLNFFWCSVSRSAAFPRSA